MVVVVVVVVVVVMVCRGYKGKFWKFKSRSMSSYHATGRGFPGFTLRVQKRLYSLCHCKTRAGHVRSLSPHSQQLAGGGLASPHLSVSFLSQGGSGTPAASPSSLRGNIGLT